jgi:hypothetical protein
MHFDSRWVQIDLNDWVGQGGEDVKKQRFRFKMNAIYKGRQYKRGDTIDLTQEEADANPQKSVTWEHLGDAQTIETGRTRVNQDLTLIHNGAQKMAEPETIAILTQFAEKAEALLGVTPGGRTVRFNEVPNGVFSQRHGGIDPRSIAFAELVDDAVIDLRRQGRREPDHVLMREAASHLRGEGVSCSMDDQHNNDQKNLTAMAPGYTGTIQKGLTPTDTIESAIERFKKAVSGLITNLGATIAGDSAAQSEYVVDREGRVMNPAVPIDPNSVKLRDRANEILQENPTLTFGQALSQARAEQAN